jgi:3-hydroxyisobutyrate dehydrogenase-like beta-hydroxyacid dehydrogenase
MGAALVRALAASGHSVAAWNRSPERAQALAGNGVTAVRSIDEAVRSAPLVVACTSTYETTQSALENVTDWSGAALVNIGTGSPHDVEMMERWAAERGVGYLDGSILCFPDKIGTPEGIILFSGSPAVWAKHEAALMSLGDASAHVSQEVRAASVMEIAIIGAFYVSAVGAYVEAATYARSQGVSAEALRSTTLLALGGLQQATEEALVAIESDDYATGQATLEVYAEGSRTGLTTMRAAGYRARLLGAAVENLETAQAAGLGKLGLYAQAKVALTADRA